MTDLLWPGDQLAGPLMSDTAFLDAMIRVEQAWLDGLIAAGIAPQSAAADLASHITAEDRETIASGADADGNPVTGLVALLRSRVPEPTARWLHRGLTSQDVVDTALTLCVRDALIRIDTDVTQQVQITVALVERHRDTPALARTLTQAALPSTLGVKFAHWLTGLLDAAEPLTGLCASLPVQIGGAVGTLAAIVELAGSADAAIALSDALAAALELTPAPPWHTTRTPITRIGDALVTCCDAWGHIAADIATASRTEIGELAEGAAGGSSTMPHKANPVRSVLIRRTVFTASSLAATLHTAAGMSVDERSDGAWHAEWATLRTLTRQSVVAGAHCTELLSGLRVDTTRAAEHLASARDLHAEQRSMTELTGRTARPDYLGVADRLVDAVLERADRFLKDSQ